MRHLGIILIIIAIVTYAIGGLWAVSDQRPRETVSVAAWSGMDDHNDRHLQDSADPCCHQMHCNAFIVIGNRVSMPEGGVTVALTEPYDAYFHRVTPPLKHPPKA